MSLPVDVGRITDHAGIPQTWVSAVAADGALRVAVTHRSYLAEHPEQAPRVTVGVLRALGSLGSAWLRRALTTRLYLQEQHEGPASISQSLAAAHLLLPQSLSFVDWLLAEGLLGKSLAGGTIPQKVSLDLLHQFLGTLILAQTTEYAEKLASPLIKQIMDNVHSASGDPVSDLAAHLSRVGSAAEWNYSSEGPHHSPRFVATIKDQRSGRTATSVGPSRKAAKRSAAQEYLRGYNASPIRPRSTPRVTPRRLAQSANSQHRSATHAICDIFRLEAQHAPLVSQALIHSSWIRENAAEAEHSRQQSNSTMAFLGNTVLAYEQALSGALGAVATSPDDRAGRLVPNEVIAAVLHDLGVEDGLLLATGARLTGSETAATAVQAIFGVIYVAKGCPRSIQEAWPEGLEDIRSTVIPTTEVVSDPKTRFQAYAVATQLEWNLSHSTRGPEHDRLYRATLEVSSPLTHDRLDVSGDWLSRKASAEQSACSQIIQVADAINGVRPTAGSRQRHAQSATRFLLRHLAQVACTESGRAQLRRRAGVIGGGLSSSRELLTWAGALDELAGTSIEVALQGLPAYFATFLSAWGQSHFGRQLEPVLAWVIDLDDPQDVDAGGESKLKHLASAYRALASTESGQSVAEITEGLVFLTRGRVTASGSCSADLTALDASYLESIITAMLGLEAHLRIHQSDTSLSLRLTPQQPPPTDQLTALSNIWSSVSQLMVAPEGSDVRVDLPPQSLRAPRGPVSAAVLQALAGTYDPLAASIANLLHDLKNEVSVARQAVPATTVRGTLRYQQLAVASQALDRAHELAYRLRGQSDLFGTMSEATTDVGATIRHTCLDLARALPPRIALHQEPHSRRVLVRLDEVRLRSIIGNLIKNAGEAIVGEGRIRVDWDSDDKAVVIEVADNGPGLPSSVVGALASGGQITSTKPGGNGIGLWSTQRALQRAGGNLQLAPTGNGTTWLVTIPLAIEVLDGVPNE